jgi:hypothetical protein
MKTTTSILSRLADVITEQPVSYKVVKFIVNVKLMEKRVKSQAGSVYVIQTRILGSTLRMERMTRPSRPKVEDGAFSAAFIAASDV